MNSSAVVTCVTPGAEPVVGEADLRPGLHLNMLGADGPGKAEAEVGAVARCELFCDDWEQAQLGEVLTGAAPGRDGPEAVTLFDSTGLAIQDLAIVQALLESPPAGAAHVRL